MKKYKYTIDGKNYEVEIGEVVENVVTVNVNGVDYNVEMEEEPKPEIFYIVNLIFIIVFNLILIL